MKTPNHNLLVKTTLHSLIPAVALALFATPIAHAGLVKFTPDVGESFTQNAIITQGTTNNGSFEGASGSTSRWAQSDGGMIEAVNGPTAPSTDPSPASSDGDWSLRLFETGSPQVSSRVDHRNRNIGLDFSNGDVFHITFDYYVPSTNGYNQLVITPLTRVGNGVGSVGNIENINPTPTSDAWVPVDLYWQLDADDGFDGLDMRFNFRRSGGDEATYEAFIDNVVITQGVIIPEPSSLALLGISLALVVLLRRRNTTQP